MWVTMDIFLHLKCFVFSFKRMQSQHQRSGASPGYNIRFSHITSILTCGEISLNQLMELSSIGIKN
jgi:hypothetical protein